MPTTEITSTYPSSCSSRHSKHPPFIRHDREYREYGASESPFLWTPSPIPPLRWDARESIPLTTTAKHSSTSTRSGKVIVHNHNKGIEEGSAPSPSYAPSRSRY